MHWVVAVVLLAVGLGGCVEPSERPGTVDEGGERSRVIVGLIDSGINPYHEIFRDEDARVPPDVINTATGQPPVRIRLTQEGSFDERVARDRAVWHGLEVGTLYWFEGTKVLGISFTPAVRPAVLDTNFSFFHGTGTASVVRDVAPDAWIVMAQMDLDTTAEDVPVGFLNEMVPAMAWLAEQPWVDVVSLSVGLEGNPPTPEWAEHARATLRAVESGKPIFQSASNLPTPTLMGASGFPWAITVGGAQPSARGEESTVSRGVDVVSDFTRWMPGRSIDGRRNLSGTSFGTPVVAGAAAQALWELRQEAGHARGLVDGVLCPCLGRNFSEADLRAAINRSGVYWDTLAYDPTNRTGHPIDALIPVLPILPTPWFQMGWGYIGEDSWPLILDVLKGGPGVPKPAEAEAYMAQQQALREAYWERAG